MDKELIAEYALRNNDPRLEFLDETDKALKQIDSEAAFWWDEDPSWAMKIHDLFVDFNISSADSYGDDGEGYNAGWVAVREDSTVHSNFYPYNYTSEVWTKDMDELQTRIDWAIEALEYLKEEYSEQL